MRERKNDREYSLEGLKGLIVCEIAFLYHYAEHFGAETVWMSKVFPFSIENGYLGVELFFIFSGFGMMKGYANRISNNEISFGEYMRRRIVRLYPLHLLTLVFVAVLESVYAAISSELFVVDNYDIYHFVLNFFCVQTGVFGTDLSFNTPAWCISIYLILYIVFFVVVKKTKSRKQFLIASALLAIYGVRLIWGGSGPLLNSLVGRGISCFFIGVLLEVAYERCLLVGRELILYILFGIAAVCVGAFHFGPEKSELVGNVQMLTILFIGPGLILSALQLKWLRTLLALRPLAYLGKLSIGIYLVHFPVQCLMRVVDVAADLQLDYSSTLVWLVYVLITIAFAATAMKLTDILVARIKEENRRKAIKERN